MHKKIKLSTLVISMSLIVGISFLSRPSMAASGYTSSSRSASSVRSSASSRPMAARPNNSYSSSSQKNRFGAGTASALSRQSRASSNTRSSSSLATALRARSAPIDRATVNTYRSRYASNGIFNRARSGGNGEQLRNSYYQAHPPVIVNGGSNGFGMLSGVFLYSLLSNSANASSFAYNHRDDADYRQWRKEADGLAKTNSDLRAQLATIDKGSSTMTGEAKGDWLPDGVPASAALSDVASKSQQPDFIICAGSTGGAYYKSAMALDFSDLVNLVVLPTSGTPETLEKIASGACSAGFAQGDIAFDEQKMTIVAKPFLETAHLICNSAVAHTSLSSLSDVTVWLPPQSGSRLTWDSFSRLNAAQAVVKVGDAVSYEDAILKARQDSKSCFFYMAAPHSSAIDAQFNKSGLKLLAIDVPALFVNSAYSKRVLSSSDYGNIIQSGWLSNSAIETAAVPVNFLAAAAWRESYPLIYPKLMLELINLADQMKATVKQSHVK